MSFIYDIKFNDVIRSINGVLFFQHFIKIFKYTKKLNEFIVNTYIPIL